MSVSEKSLKKHYEWQGKIEVITRCPIESKEDLSLAVVIKDGKILRESEE